MILLNCTPKVGHKTTFGGAVQSYKISKRPILKQVLDMVEDATRKIKETKGIILHSDQGWQYQNK